ncbi:MAG: 4'-phosphopantetheinyl transferase superfamily protein [Anaeromyxobacteraceae bacterium]
MVGIGTDIVETRDIAGRLARSENLLEFVFSEDEKRQGEAHSVPARSYAGMFAAKEAFLKAIGLGVLDGIPLREIEVVGAGTRACRLLLGPSAAAALRRAGGTKAELSTSIGPGFAMAMVVVT